MRDVTDETFEGDVLQTDRPVVVDFWAPWCGPCKVVEPALEQLASASDKVSFVKLDVDENPQTAARFDVLSIPTVILFAGGEDYELLASVEDAQGFAVVGRVEEGEGLEFLLHGEPYALAGWEHYK